MIDLVSTTTGLYPLPDDAKERLADLKGHQKGDLIDGSESNAVADTYREVRERLITLQRDAGLDRIVEGQARWDDMLAHPLSVNESVDQRGIVRYYDNNNFYRDPVIVDALSAETDVATELEAASQFTDNLQAVIPGPYTLTDLATNEYYGDETEVLAAIAEMLAGEVAEFPPVSTLWLMEPSLVVTPPEEELRVPARRAIDEVADAVNASVVAHTYFGSLEETMHAHLIDATVDAIGYDLVNAPESAARLTAEYGTLEEVALGVVDGRNTIVETAETIRDRVRWFLKQSRSNTFERVFIAPNTETFYLPVGKFEAKLAALANAADQPLDVDQGKEVQV